MKKKGRGEEGMKKKGRKVRKKKEWKGRGRRRDGRGKGRLLKGHDGRVLTALPFPRLRNACVSCVRYEVRAEVGNVERVTFYNVMI